MWRNYEGRDWATVVLSSMAQIPRNFERREDEMLLELVKQYGTDSWPTIAAALGNRTARQCRNRYGSFLAPGVNNDPWTPDEDDLLKSKYNDIGPKWAVLRQFFPGRSDLNIKNRFAFLSRNRPDVRHLKERYVAEHPDEARSAVAKRQKRRDSEDNAFSPVTIDALFQSLPYYMKRCLLLETIMQGHDIPVPPHGVCDEWQDIAVEPIPQMPEADGQEKQ
jgi:hypothetical protein